VVSETSWLDPWQVAVFFLVGAPVFGLLESRVKEQRTAYAVAVGAGLAAAFLTPAPDLLDSLIQAVRGLFA
jgi:hypothetical protein